MGIWRALIRGLRGSFSVSRGLMGVGWMVGRVGLGIWLLLLLWEALKKNR